ncbi:hypothetical protein GQ457_03G011590 [Hibiscus cannabinus]
MPSVEHSSIESVVAGGSVSKLAVHNHRLEKLLTSALKAPPATVVGSDGQLVENEDYEIYVAQDSTLFVGAETAAAIRSTVLKFFASRSRTTVMSLHYRLRSLKKGDASMRDFVSKVKEVCDAIASCGSSISDLENIATIFNGLPGEYQLFVAVITANRDPYTLDEAVSILFDVQTQLHSFNHTEFPHTLSVAQVSGSNHGVGCDSGVGFAANSGTVNAQANLVYISRHVVFDESVFPLACYGDGVSQDVAAKGSCSKISDVPVVPSVEQLWKDGCSVFGGAQIGEVPLVVEPVTGDVLQATRGSLVVEPATDGVIQATCSLFVEPANDGARLEESPLDEGHVRDMARLEEGSLGVEVAGIGVSLANDTLLATEMPGGCVGLPSMPVGVGSSAQFQTGSESIHNSLELSENLESCGGDLLGELSSHDYTE